MTPEEKYHSDRWFVLQKIREKELYAPNKNEVAWRFNITPYSQFENPSPSAQINILKQLANEGAIKIIDEESKSGYGAYYLFVLQIQRPKFDELYHAEENLKNEGIKATSFVGQQANTENKITSQPDNQVINKAEKKKLCVLEKLKEEYDLTPKTPVRTHIYFGYSYVRPAGEATLYGEKLSAWLQECNLNDRLELENILAIFQQENLISKFIYSEQDGNLKIQFPEDFDGRYNKYKNKLLGSPKQIPQKRMDNGDIKANTQEVNKFVISVKDREIWVNDYLIGKPHAVGSNFEFFEYVRSKPANTPIERDKMPKWGDGVGYASVKEEVKNKSFIKMLNELGFKGEILKAFFYKRSKDSLTYRGNEITKQDLEKAGIKIPLFLKELEVAHTKNSPE